MQYLIQGNNIILTVEGEVFTITSSHLNYDAVKKAIVENRWDDLVDLVNPKATVIAESNGRLAIKGDILYWDDIEIHNTLTDRLVKMMQQGFPVSPMIKFLENLMSNPSYRAVNELYTFLEKNSLPITFDGYFLAFKKIREDYLDVHSATISNAVGSIIEMPRNMVNDNQNQTCSYGLHFCGESYLKHFGGNRIVVLKINPCDVVSIPTDYNNAKGRCCKYEVVAEVTNTDLSTVFSALVVDKVGTEEESLNESSDQP